MTVLESPRTAPPLAASTLSIGEPRGSAKVEPAHLVVRRIDTWLVGGLSVAVFVVIAALQPLASASPSIGNQIRNLALVAPTLALLVNYPHFVASYRLAYWRRDAAWRHAFTLVFVPGALVVAVVLAYTTFDSTIAIGGYTIESFGSRLAGWLVGFMFLTVGWHYVKQAYGCAMAGARLRGFAVPPESARILRYSMFPLWVSVWARANASRGGFDFSGIRYGSLELPRWVVPATNVAIVAGVVAALAVFGTLWHRNRIAPPPLATMPVVAMFVWWIPAAFNPTFFVLVPMFHSLQYLPFATKVEQGRIAARHPARRSRTRRFAVTAAAVCGAAWLLFEIGPDLADSASHSSTKLGVFFFAAMVPVLINIHHYFIDHVIWRRSEPEVFEYLTAAPAPGR